MRAKKRMAVVLSIVIFGILIIFQLSGAEIFKWVDGKEAVHFTDDPATIPEKYREDRIKQQEEKELQTQTIKEKMAEVATAMSNVASAVAAYHEDLNSWPLFDRADAIAIQTSLGVPIPKNIIGSITITSPTDDQVTITATIIGIDSTVDYKALILRGKLTEQGLLWYWDGTVPSIYIPSGKGDEDHQNLNYGGDILLIAGGILSKRILEEEKQPLPKK